MHSALKSAWVVAQLCICMLSVQILAKHQTCVTIIMWLFPLYHHATTACCCQLQAYLRFLKEGDVFCLPLGLVGYCHHLTRQVSRQCGHPSLKSPRILKLNFLSHPQHGRWVPITEAAASRGPFQFKGSSFSPLSLSACSKRIILGLGSLQSDILGFLPYNIKHPEKPFAVHWCYMNRIKLNKLD